MKIIKEIPKVLDDRQEAYLEWLLTPETMRIPPTKAAYQEEHGLSATTLKRWAALPHFRAAYESFVKANIATPERVQKATDYAYDMAYGGKIPAAEAIKWANHWADLAGLKKVEPQVQKSAAEAMAELSDEELEAVMYQGAITEAKRRKAV